MHNTTWNINTRTQNHPHIPSQFEAVMNALLDSAKDTRTPGLILSGGVFGSLVAYTTSHAIKDWSIPSFMSLDFLNQKRTFKHITLSALLFACVIPLRKIVLYLQHRNLQEKIRDAELTLNHLQAQEKTKNALKDQ